MFRKLRGKELRKLVAVMRFPDDLIARQHFEGNTEPLHFSSALWLRQHPEAANADLVTASELRMLLREDQRAAVLDRLEKMEAHYAEVATLSADKVEQLINAASPDDPGITSLKQVLANGEDPRRAVARQILGLVPIARRRVENGKEALELVEIERLNATANSMLILPHAKRGLQILVGKGRKGASDDDRRRADKVLWVEGPNDVPVFKAWLAKCPENRAQKIAILPLAGHQTASRYFDTRELLDVNPNCFVILDSERTAQGGQPESKRRRVQNKLKQNDIPHLLTERRCTENYFSSRAIKSFYKNVPAEIDPFSKLSDQVHGFSKNNNHAIANEMNWAEIADTDIGQALLIFLKKSC